jgi:hypothetical protein
MSTGRRKSICVSISVNAPAYIIVFEFFVFFTRKSYAYYALSLRFQPGLNATNDDGRQVYTLIPRVAALLNEALRIVQVSSADSIGRGARMCCGDRMEINRRSVDM